MNEKVNLVSSFIIGLLSFLSPCVLPLLPSFLSFISGVSYKDLNKNGLKLFLSTLFFCLGFSLVFVLLAITTSTLLSKASLELKSYLRLIGGILIILFALDLIFNFLIILKKEFKFNIKNNSLGYLSSLLIGATFALGWTPCIGPFLASILSLTIIDKSNAALYLAFYCMGFSLPFLILSLFYSRMIVSVNYLKRHMGALRAIGGFVLLLVGILIILDKFSFLNSILLDLGNLAYNFYMDNSEMSFIISAIFFLILFFFALFCLFLFKKTKKISIICFMLGIIFFAFFILSLIKNFNLFSFLSFYLRGF